MYGPIFKPGDMVNWKSSEFHACTGVTEQGPFAIRTVLNNDDPDSCCCGAGKNNNYTHAPFKTVDNCRIGMCNPRPAQMVTVADQQGKPLLTGKQKPIIFASECFRAATA